MRWLSAAVPVTALLVATTAAAEPVDTSPPIDVVDPAGDGEPSAGLRTAGVATWLLPGALLHGAGHFTIGRRTTAYRLLAMEGVGLLMVIVAGVPLVATGASRYLTRSTAVIGALGVGLFGTSLQADLWGVLVPLEDRSPPLVLPRVEAEAGYRYVHDTRFRFANFIVNRVEARAGRMFFRPAAWHALDDGNRRLSFDLGYRAVGAGVGERSDDGSFFELSLGVRHHSYRPERFAVLTPESFALARVDLRHIDPLLAGSFGELGVGFGLQLYDYDGLPLGTDVESLLLARLGFGFFLGSRDGVNGEFVSYYDHRHDAFAGGFTQGSIGIPGHAGFSGRAYFSEQLGVAGVVELGSAVMAGGSLLVRIYDGGP